MSRCPSMVASRSAISRPRGRTGTSAKPVRIADLGVTAASLFGIELKSAEAGKDLSPDLK